MIAPCILKIRDEKMQDSRKRELEVDEHDYDDGCDPIKVNYDSSIGYQKLTYRAVLDYIRLITLEASFLAHHFQLIMCWHRVAGGRKSVHTVGHFIHQSLSSKCH